MNLLEVIESKLKGIKRPGIDFFIGGKNVLFTYLY